MSRWWDHLPAKIQELASYHFSQLLTKCCSYRGYRVCVWHGSASYQAFYLWGTWSLSEIQPLCYSLLMRHVIMQNTIKVILSFYLNKTTLCIYSHVWVVCFSFRLSIIWRRWHSWRWTTSKWNQRLLATVHLLSVGGCSPLLTGWDKRDVDM